MLRNELDHIGIAVEEIDQAIEYYQWFGFECTKPLVDPVQNVKLALCRNERYDTLELIAAIDETSPSFGVLQRRGESPYHLCYKVSSIDDFFQQLDQEQFDYEVVSPPQPACLFGGQAVAFIYLPKIGLLELLEDPQMEDEKKKDYDSTALIVASDLAANLRFYQLLGYKILSQKEEVQKNQVYLTLEKENSGRLQIIIPSEESKEMEFLKQNGPALLQLLLLVDDMDELIAGMEEKGRNFTEFSREQIVPNLNNVNRLIQINDVSYLFFYNEFSKADMVVPEMKAMYLTESDVTESQKLVLELDDIQDAQMNIIVQMDLLGMLQSTVFKEAVQTVLQKYPHLTSIFVKKGEIIQQTFSQEDVKYRYLDYTIEDYLDQTSKFSELLANEKRSTFDLRESGMRCTLVKRGETLHTFKVIVHSSLVDQWSISCLISEIGRVYHRRVHSLTFEILAGEYDYFDYVCWNKELMQNAYMNMYLDYWFDQYATPPIQLELVIDQKGGQKGQSSDHSFSISQELTDQLHCLAEEREIPLEQIMLAGYILLLRNVSQMNDITVGVPLDTHKQLLGNISNILPVRVNTSEMFFFNQLLEEVHHQMSHGLEFKLYPLYALIEKLGLQFTEMNPLFSTMLVSWLDDFAFQSGELEWKLTDYQYPLLGCDLTLILFAHSGELRGNFTYNKNIFNQQLIELFAERYLKILNTISQIITV
ncbi:MAG: VOC family protein [Halanaerobiales bacterium]|nr:VOC family protein [Halanaerobiales bacterium]